MANAKRPPHHQRTPSSLISSPSINRRHTLRRVASRIAAHASSDSISSPVIQDRPVLVPVHTNLRRLPSRVLSQSHKDKEASLPMREAGHVIAGSKRKRVASSNENAHNHGRSTRGSGRLKRLRTTAINTHSTDESQSDESEMEIDPPTLHAPPSDGSQSEPGEQIDDSEEEITDGSSDENDSEAFLLHHADARRLRRERKSSLIHLYQLMDLPDDAEHMKKSEIIDAIIYSRDDDTASGPPSSPPGKTDAGASSDESSDDGNVAGGEETDFLALKHSPNANALRRRVTMNHLAKSPMRPSKSIRSMSMGNLLGNGEPSVPLSTKRKTSTRSDLPLNDLPTLPAKRVSNRSSPSTSTTVPLIQSPLATRLRSRKASSTKPPAPSAPISDGSNKGKGKAKAKQVEFSNDVEVHLQSPSRKNSKGKEARQLVTSESDLTELEELERSLQTQPSPRRLRSKDRPNSIEKEDNDATPVANSKRHVKPHSVEIEGENEDAEEDSNQPTRVTPMRKAKKKIGSLRESDEDEEAEELDDEEAENDDEEDEDEVDELVSSASATPPPDTLGRRTPLRRRLRPRRDRNKAVPTGDEENEGDDEEEKDQENVEEEEGDQEQEEVEEEQDEEEEGQDDEEEEQDDEEEEQDDEEEEQDEEEDQEEMEEEEEEPTVVVEPRKLRNGKIVGEDDSGMDVDEESIGEEDEEDEADEDEDDMEGSEVVEDAAIEVDTQSEVEHDATMEEEVDLTVATAKTLIRLRRDNLVRLCETRDLDPSGTKNQLAEALLQWRDRQANDMSSPSSSGTIRPSSNRSSNRRKRRGKQHSSSTDATVPVLLRSQQVHTGEPRTPVPGKEKDSEELELDLESLGLEDREIPPEKLVKQEKIGSGGFKDVYIGKFKGRKIAISEFRGQLSAMDIKELKLLGAFNHPNIVRFLGVSIPENTKETPVMIVSELCSNGDLFDYVRNVGPPAFRKILQMMLDVARGLEYLHTRKPSIIHRDCKSSNILITAKGTAKIADFGLAKVKQSTRSMVRSLVGTVNWQAPELWHAHPKYNHKVDVFSCAMVFWEMLQWHLPTKKFPWEGMNEHAIYEIVGAKRQRPSVTGLKKQWCPEVVALIERMWAHEHQDRPTMTEVVQNLEDLISKY